MCLTIIAYFGGEGKFWIQYKLTCVNKNDIFQSTKLLESDQVTVAVLYCFVAVQLCIFVHEAIKLLRSCDSVLHRSVLH